MMIYVFYRGEEPVFVGVLRECMEHFGMNERSVRWHATPTARRRANQGIDNNRLYAEKVEEGDDQGQRLCARGHGATNVSGNGRRYATA
jgi:hypothetical protein